MSDFIIQFASSHPYWAGAAFVFSGVVLVGIAEGLGGLRGGG